MDQKHIYVEEQKFNQAWLNAILYVVLFSALSALVIIFVMTPYHILAFLPFVLALIIFVFMKSAKLVVRIDENKIAFRFPPLQINDRSIHKSAINNIAVVSYDPIAEYGGWGIRIGKSGKACTTSGSYGVRINYGQNNNILLGTTKPEEMSKALTQLGYHPGPGIFAAVEDKITS